MASNSFSTQERHDETAVSIHLLQFKCPSAINDCTWPASRSLGTGIWEIRPHNITQYMYGSAMYSVTDYFTFQWKNCHLRTPPVETKPIARSKWNFPKFIIRLRVLLICQPSPTSGQQVSLHTYVKCDVAAYRFLPLLNFFSNRAQVAQFWRIMAHSTPSTVKRSFWGLKFYHFTFWGS